VSGEEVVALGGPPWRIERLRGIIAIKNPHLRRATVCDANGMPMAEVGASRSGDFFTVTLPTDALYVVLH
jgi:hypothetical protein